MKRPSRISLLGAAAAFSLIIGTPAAQAHDADAHSRVHSFEGSCSLEGPVTFDPPATNTQQRLAVDYQAAGTCSGTLDGQNVSNAPVAMHNTAHADGSCLRAQTVAPGIGALRFADDGPTIYYTLEFTYVGTEGVQTLQGQRSGSASGHGTFLTPNTPPDTALRCASDGVAQLPMDLTLATQSPLMSSRGTRR